MLATILELVKLLLGTPPYDDLVRFDHWFVSDYSSPAPAVRVTPVSQQIDFYDPISFTIKPDPVFRLDLITDVIAKKPVYKTKVDSKHIAISVVDLSGANPKFAGINETTIFAAGSSAKVVGLLGCFQLKADIWQVLRMEKNLDGSEVNPATISDVSTIMNAYWLRENPLLRADELPSITSMFDYNPATKSVTFKPDFYDASLDHISEGNIPGGLPIALLGLPYVASVLFSYGLTNRTNGGLWVRDIYVTKITFSGKTYTTSWQKRIPPGNGLRQSINAISVALFFALAAKGKLVNPSDSGEILKILELKPTPSGKLRGCISDDFNVDLLPSTNAPGDLLASKCGHVNNTDNHCMYYKNSSIDKNVVVNILTTNSSANVGNEILQNILLKLGF